MTELGQLSLYLVTAAMTCYLIATVTFAIDLSRRVASAPSRVREPQLVAAGAPAEAAGSATADAAALPPATPVNGAARTNAGGAAEPATGSGDAAGPTQVRRRAAAIGMSTFVLGALFLLIGIVLRGIAAGRVPWANMYEFTMVAVFVASALFLGIQRRRDVRYLGTFISLLAVLALFLALTVLYTDPAAVQPALQSYWLAIHVSIASSAMGVFAVAATTSVLQLVKDRAEHRGTAGRLAAKLPTADSLERLSYRINAVGFVLWTFVLISGSIWAEHAWGRFWGWDPKEVWSFVIWVVYAAYLHARSTRGWEGRRAAWFSIIGFVSILVNYYVVNFFFSSLHSYSGV
ncbi:c-type cytochrome biogenesis protein CcsB [Miniimonas arenae]|uniref:C-type cytochrome biogenesis protein CcsB n=2 Tax=Miniimonas arenae TaxID=676201 RepID=A0A5C5BGZ0_9MICO|nr:c-type cytochrome biogenesis protein CcsB [Miniimonas arenae]TNU76748.1 c-type cytochrome biogenesis protein CcsB [Miniimonas arenae]